MSEDTTTTTPAKALLLRAADYIADHDFIQGDLGTKGGRCCLLGALSLASGLRESPSDLDEDASPEESEALDVLALQVAEFELQDGEASCDIIAEWNDIPGRTKHETIEALQGAAARLP